MFPRLTKHQQQQEEGDFNNFFPIPNPIPAPWITKAIDLPSDFLYNSVLLVFSPFLFALSFLSDSMRRADETKQKVDSAVVLAVRAPSMAIHGGGALLKKVVYGLVGAVYVGMIILSLMVVAAILGIVTVRSYAEEPVIMNERLHFDYSEIHPTAVLAFGGVGAGAGFGGHKHMLHYNQLHPGVPVGHTYHVSLVFWMPESDYNREMGMFQVTTEVISTSGSIISRSSHPCMLMFRSWPIRMVRTFVMGVPLLLGLTSETQTLKIAALKHKETLPRTEAIAVTLVPRAGTHFLPQLYEAEIVLKSKLPWAKELVHNWKWTIYVWASLYWYALLLVITIGCLKPMNLLTRVRESRLPEYDVKTVDESMVETETNGLSKENSAMKAMLHYREALALGAATNSSATSMSLTREDSSTISVSTGEDDVDDAASAADSESVCMNGADY